MKNIVPYLSTYIPYLKRFVPTKRYYLGATIVVCTVLFVFYTLQLIDLFLTMRKVEARVPQVIAHVVARDFEGTQALLKETQEDVQDMQKNVHRFFPFTEFPYIRTEVAAADRVFLAADVGLDTGTDIIKWIATLPNAETFEQSFNSISISQKRELLKAVSESESFWQDIRMQGDLIVDLLTQAQRMSSFPIVDTYVDDTIGKITKAQQAFNQIQPWLPLVPQVLGYPTDATYLMLLQNNTELRPTGGFIGTYGTVTLSNGSVKNFVTDNVYNLDEPAKAFNTKVPPQPLQTYIKQSQWFLRDVNWDPDFATTAEMAMQFYKDERGPVRSFNGVFALTPDFIQDILTIVGPVTVDGTEFTAENLVDILAYHVELGFKEEGITIYNRKQIIDDIAQKLQEKLFNLSIQDMQTLAPIVLDAFAEKKIQLYFTEPNIQSFVEENNWGGTIQQTKGDYVFVVDANLGSLKSDPAIERTITYTITPNEKGQTADAQVAITYNHTGSFDWKTTRYRTYTRLYVPAGSKFLSAQGNEEPIAVAQQHGKTELGTFISIEPGDTETLTFNYQLPQSVYQAMLNGNYTLYGQKQAGTTGHIISVDITLPTSTQLQQAPKGVVLKSSKQLIGSFPLHQDTVITTVKK